MSESFDWVFTSGGIGPTHDDLTMEGVSHAFGMPLEVSESIASRIERAVGSGGLDESQRKMAMIPRGAHLVDSGDLWFPVVIVRNVHVFPGIPDLLQRKFQSIRERFRGVPFVLRRVFVTQRESEIASVLNALLVEYPELLLGSYPRVGEGAFHVLLTLESRDPDYVKRALDALVRRLPAEAIHKVE